VAPGEEFRGQEKVFSPHQDTRCQLASLFFQTVVVAAKKAGQLSEVLDDPWVVLSQAGQKIAAEAVAEVGVRAVGTVIPVGNFSLGEAGFYLPPADVEEGVDDQTPVAQGGDSTEARGAGPAEEAHENRFSLVVGVVSQGNACEFSPTRRREEETEALFPGGLLEGPSRRRDGTVPGRRSEVKGEPVASGQVTDKVRVGFRDLSAQPVVVVGNGQREAGLGLDFEEEVKEADGIGATRHGNEDHAAPSGEGWPGKGAAKTRQKHLLSNPALRGVRRESMRLFARQPTPAVAIRS
jgi:hypothetical protein